MSENTPSIQGSVSLAPTPPKKPYRLITGPDNAEFCDRVSAALVEGYVLHGSPTSTSNGGTVIVGQAVIWPVNR